VVKNYLKGPQWNRPLLKPLPQGGRGFKNNKTKSPSLLGEGDLGGEAEKTSRRALVKPKDEKV
jgi:hypothetical protein